ncbi:MAG: alpha/beta-hydrolase family protein [Actinomycetes bacterium]
MATPIYVGGVDISARAGLLLGAFSTGLSYQPNLLSRGTRDQAMITGVAAASAFGWGTTAHSFLRSTADRLPLSGRSATARVITGLAVDGAATVLGAAILRSMPAREHEDNRRALIRLAATGACSAGAAGLGADLLELRRDRPGGRLAALLAALATAGAAYASTRNTVSGSVVADDEPAHENVHREVALPVALGSGVLVTLVLLGAARAESALSSTMSRGAAVVLGGSPQDHRTLGRLGSFGTLAGLGWLAVSAVNRKLAVAGGDVETANVAPPDLPEVTGGPGSRIPWTDQSRESSRWLSTVLRADAITDVMGQPALQPIRVYASLKSAATPENRAQLLLAEIDRTEALSRSVFALFSPTGSGYVNYVACETLEYLTRGDCASAAIQYSVLPSALSLTKVPYATAQTRMVVNGVVERLMSIPEKKRPTFVMFGESLGSQVSQEMFRGQHMTGPTGVGLDAAVWIGTPVSTDWRYELWGDRTVSQAPSVGPGNAYLPRAIRDWAALPEEDRRTVRFLFLQNGDDPVPKFGRGLAWKRPDWLGPDDQRPPGAPRGTRWMPITTFFTTFLDLQNALSPTPGVFDEGGHDYRREIPEAVRTVFGLEASDEQMARVQEALRRSELHWETQRLWLGAESTATPERAKAEEAVLAKVGAWTGKEVDRAGVEEIALGASGEES